MTDKDDKIVAEYTALLERSHSLFQGLRCATFRAQARFVLHGDC